MITKQDVTLWKVLVVDDHADSREVASLTLQMSGATVLTADSGQAALDLLQEAQPTLVLLDLSMPTMDGWETLTKIREIPHMESTPVIALTAHAMDGDKDRVLRAGFDHYVSKPFSPLTLVDDLLFVFNDNPDLTARIGQHHTPDDQPAA